MPPLLVLDLTGLSLCLVISMAIALMVGGAGFRRPINRSFVAFALMESGWAASSLLLRIFLWLGKGNPDTMLELAIMFCALTFTFLLLFCSRYARLRRQWPVWIVIAVVFIVEANAAFLFQGRLAFGPHFHPGGILLYSFSRLGFVGTCIPLLCVLLALYLLHRGRRRKENDLYLRVAAVFLLGGFVAGGVAQIHFPIMALTNTAGVAILGWGTIRRQLFNPLRDLAADLRERAHQQELVSQISRRTTTLLDLHELLWQTAELIQSRFQYNAVAILLVDGDDLVMKAFTHPYDRDFLANLRLKIGKEGICGWVAAHGAPLLVGDVRRDARYFPGGTAGTTRSELAVPIRRNDRIIGVLDVQSTRVNAFRTRDVVTQQTIADQLSSSIENARLYAETSRRAERLAVVNRISAAVGAVLDLDDLLSTVYEEVTRLFEADAFFIALYDATDSTLFFRIQVDEGKREDAVREPLGEGLTSRVIATGKPLLLNDVSHFRPPDLHPKMWGTGKVPSSWIGVPMLIGERIIGVMSVQRYDPRPYDADDLLLAGTIADQVAIAVENARLYEEVRLELEVQQRTEKVLRESEEKFRTVADQSPNMIFIHSEGRLVYANLQCELSLECPREELYRTNLRPFIDPDFLPRIDESFARHLRGEEVGPCECLIVSRTGRRIDAILSSKTVSYDGRPAVLGLVTDITTRKRGERLLLSLNTAAFAMEQALTPLEVFPAAIHPLATLGFDAAILLCDTGGERTLRMQCSIDGVTGEIHAAVTDAKETPSRSFDEIPEVARAMDGRTALFAFLDAPNTRLLFDGTGITTHTAFPGASTGVILSPLVVGESLYGLLLTAGSDLGPDDLPIFTAFARQVAATWRKTRLVGDLEKSLEQLRQMQSQLLHAQKMEAVGRLAGGIAHDFNNLLTVISGYASLLTDSMAGNEPALADLAQIRGTIKRASALTSRLLAFSRKQVLQPVTLDMNKVMSASVALLRPLIGEDIELVVKPSSATLFVRADPYQMEQVLMNLAVNARDAMPNGGTLILRTDSATVEPGDEAPPLLPQGLPAGRWAVLSVRDNGIGMSEETRAHIFEPFFTTKEEGKGSGLGLSTVYGIVTQSGGHVRVDSALGAGSTFTICFPIVEAQSAAALDEDQPRSLPYGSGTVLLVEDEADVRELARRVLERGGYRVIPAVSAREALLIAEGSAMLDLVLTDVVMPGGMSGLEMGERLSRTRPTLPVLYMSGYSEELRTPHGPPNAPSAFLGKPFHPDELLSRVKVMLKR